MDALFRLEGAFERGVLVAPYAPGPTFVDLVRVLLERCGLERQGLVEEPGPVQKLVAPADHYVFVLIDGLGDLQLQHSRCARFLRRTRKLQLRAVFPSTTTAALTTLATAAWPGSHGALGWWLYLFERALPVVSLPFIERNTNRPLGDVGLSPEELFPVPSVWRHLSHEPSSILPLTICDSVYSTYASGGTSRFGYRTPEEAITKAHRVVRQAAGPSLTYVYLPQLDSTMHEQGASGADVDTMLRVLDTALSQLADALGDSATLVVTADHGHIDAPMERRHCIAADDPLAQMLLAQPSGEPRVPFMHVREGHEDAFTESFGERFGDDFVLLTTQEAERRRLFGPGPLSPRARARLGTCVGLPTGRGRLYVEPSGPSSSHLGAHGGLLPEEMYVPLCVA